jgi:hypothetical protein
MNPRVLALLIVTGTLGWAQTGTGTITGSVMDGKGTAVPGARIEARDQATNLEFTCPTNIEGMFVLSALPPGTYEVTVTAPGFARVSRPDVAVAIQSRVGLSFALEVGELNQTITVTDDPPLLETQTSSVGQGVDSRFLTELPLIGRNYSHLAVLAPGATPNSGSRAADGFSLNGNRTFQNVYLIDGIDNNNYILGVDTNSTQAMRPSVDAIQEFRVETSNYSAEFGRAAGGVISVSTKSGTNALHGSAFEFLRNDRLDANDYFANRTGRPRPAARRNLFGGTLGGPLVRNRTFLFASYEGLRAREAQTVTTTVPSGEQASGDFGDKAVYDPLNVVGGARQLFPGNRIPDNRIDAVARKLAALYPSPNLAGTANNYAANVAVADREDAGDVRGDHRFSDRDAAFVRFSKVDREISRGSVFAPPGNGGAGGLNDFPSVQTSRAQSLALSETHIISASQVNEFRAGYTRNASDVNSPARQSLYAQFGILGVPQIDGLTGLPAFLVTGYSTLGDRTFAPNPKLTQVRQFMDNATWVRGRHTLRFGADARFTQNFAGTSSGARGLFTFNGQFTSQTPGQGSGDALADLLLGQTSSATLTTKLQGDFRNRYYGLFANDTWRASRKLTLTLGLRYELQSPPWEHNNNQYDFDLASGTMTRASGTGILSRTFSRRDWNNFAPRLGFAYELDSKTVLRGAAGVFYGSWGYQAIGQMGAANPPNFISVTFPSENTASRSAIVLAEGFPAGTLDPANLRNPAAVSLPADLQVPEVYQWNFGVERQTAREVVLSVAYVGAGSSWLPGYIDVNDPPPGPGAINPRRPYPAYGTIILNSGFAHSTYHSLQAKADKRFSRGLSLLSSYTWGHSIDNSVSGEDTGNGSTFPQNPGDTRAEKASSGIDVRHRWVTSFVYETPRWRSRGWRMVAGGWRIGGILTMTTGPPFTPTITPNPANTTGPVRPDRIADGNLARGNRSVDRWFDVGAFVAQSGFAYGNCGRDVLRAPGLAGFDGMLARVFPLRDALKLELRGEFFNLTNSAHFAKPDANIAIPQQAGKITATVSPNRQVQIAARIVF